ncbi:MAG TPA: LysM peptidoglycan-binding domain-containing protein [Opitutaceae bacterium]|nr:LysM peptidoglycan-binding domain-containing protein [Opitutaceae bacterium]
MKILKIFGVVVAIHAFAFVLIFANPGCSSTNSKPPAVATAPAAPPPAPVVAFAPPAGDAPVITGVSAGGFDPNAPAVAASVRYSPTRPGTPAATAVQALPVPDVTPATTYTVGSGDSLWTVAKKNHLTVAELAKANNLAVTAKLKANQKLLIPAKAASAAAPAAAADGAPTYKVRPGDSLASIAKRAGTTVAVLKDLNGLKTDTVAVNRGLKLPAGAVVADTAASGAAASKPPTGDSLTHTVKEHESLSSIAAKYSVKVGDIATANNITDPAKIRPGMVLVIPGWKAPKSAKTTEASANTPTVLTPDQDTGSAAKPMTQADIPVIRIEEPASAGKP